MYCVLCGMIHDGRNGLDTCPKSELSLSHLWTQVGVVKDWFTVKRVFGPLERGARSEVPHDRRRPAVQGEGAMRWLAWKLWNRTRYYWPQSQSRKRAIASLKKGYAEHGMEWEPPRPWWVPW